MLAALESERRTVNVLRLAMYGLFKSIKDDSLRADPG
jgi:hypothetical protein